MRGEGDERPGSVDPAADIWWPDGGPWRAKAVRVVWRSRHERHGRLARIDEYAARQALGGASRRIGVRWGPADPARIPQPARPAGRHRGHGYGRREGAR